MGGWGTGSYLKGTERQGSKMRRVLEMDGDHGVTLGKHLVKCTVPLNCTLKSGDGGKL